MTRRATPGAPWHGDKGVRRALKALGALLPPPASTSLSVHAVHMPETGADGPPAILEVLLLTAAWQAQRAIPSDDLLRAAEQHWPLCLRERWLPSIERVPLALRRAAFEHGASLPPLSVLLENLLAWQLQPLGTTWCVVARDTRRRTGSHFTPQRIADRLVENCLAPLLREPEAWRGWRLGDPALGAGGLLLAAFKWLTEQLAHLTPTCADELRYELVRHGAFGTDISPLAVLVAHLELAAFARAEPTDDAFHEALAQHLVVADALFGHDPELASPNDDGSPCGTHLPPPPMQARAGLPRYETVFERPNSGFDAIVSNPPWVAYVGRAAQPLPGPTKAHFQARYRAFKKYRTLHGLFVERCAGLLRRGGRLGLLLPSSVADLDGYAPTRAAHDHYCQVDPCLLSFGEHTFDGILQPTMALHSTRVIRTEPVGDASTAGWRLERPDLSLCEQQLLDRLLRLDRIPPHLVGERGYQTSPHDRAQLKPLNGPLPPNHVALLTGTEVTEYRTLTPRLCVDPARLSGRLRSWQAFGEVALVIRQTARYPMASLSPGLAFRNSVLAGFEDEAFPGPLLLSYLNSTPVRWFHFQSQRDARQGMPQTKIAHLRRLPRPPDLHCEAGRSLFEWGSRLGTRNQGIEADERRVVDRIVGLAWGLSDDELKLVLEWGLRHPPPKSRLKPTPFRATEPSQAEGQAHPSSVAATSGDGDF